MIDLRRNNGALTLYATHRQPPRAMWIAGSIVVSAALYFMLEQQIPDPAFRLVSALICLAIPFVTAAVLYLRPHSTSSVTAFDAKTRSIRSEQKHDRGKDVVVELGFDEVAALVVTEDNAERPRNDVLSVTLVDGRKIVLAMKSRQYTEGGEGQDLHKVAAFIRSETGLPEGP
jgi:signal transduction histidine kinase